MPDTVDLRLTRHPMNRALRSAAWALRDRSTACDAAYVALADALGAPLWTRDARLARGAPAATEVLLW